MIAINHALTGALIGLVSGRPAIAIPVAFVSHFLCDMIPHFGNGQEWVKTKVFRLYLLTDAALCGLLVLFLAWQQPANWQLACLTAFVAASPDFWSIRFFARKTNGAAYHPGLIRRFSQAIQWFERPIGAVVDAAWLLAATYLLLHIVR